MVATQEHIREQQTFLLDRFTHFTMISQEFEAKGDQGNAVFCLGVANESYKAWLRVDKGLNPFGHAGLEDDTPESACSGVNCELKQAGIEVVELMRTN